MPSFVVQTEFVRAALFGAVGCGTVNSGDRLLAANAFLHVALIYLELLRRARHVVIPQRSAPQPPHRRGNHHACKYS